MWFDLKLAVWQLRGQTTKIFLVLFCIGIGVAARISIGSFTSQLNRSLFRQARTLLGGDLEIAARTPLEPERMAGLLRLLPDGSRTQNLVSFVTMATVPGGLRSRLVEVHAVESSYPFYGELRLSADGRQESPGLAASLDAAEPVAFVQRELLPQLEADLGGVLRIGQTDFRLGGIILEEPGGGASLFSLGPRVLISIRQVEKTGLAGFGSRLYHSTLVALPQSGLAESVADRLKLEWGLDRSRDNFREVVKQESVSVRTFLDKQDQMRRFFDRMGDYLRLSALLALVLGGIGVGTIVRGYLAQNLETIAVLKALGLTSARVARFYILEIFFLGLLGSVAGWAIGIALQNFFLFILAGLLPVPVEAGLDWASIAWGTGLGVLVSVYFAAFPLLQVQAVRPLRIFREDLPMRTHRRGLALLFAFGALAFAAVAIYDSRSVVKALSFECALLGGALLLYGAGKAVLPRISRIRMEGLSFPLRHGLSNLTRPGLHPLGAILSLGLASFLLGVLAIYQASLIRELNWDRAPKGGAPSFFMIDIQDDQAEGVKQFLDREGARKVFLSPMVKARYRRLNGQEVVRGRRLFTRERERQENLRHREQNLSYRALPGENEAVVDGAWMDAASGGVEASLERNFAKRLGANIGDTLTFDVQGVELDAKVTSIRKVRWASFLPAFFILITPDALAGAPKTWVGSVFGLDGDIKDRIQTQMSRLFPNVTILDLAETSRKIIEILNKISWSVRFVALFSLGAGLVVLIGIALTTIQDRRKEIALLKALGASRRMLLGSVAVEFGALGGLSSLFGLALSGLAGWILIARAFDVPFYFPWRPILAIGASVVGLSCLVGLAVCQKIFNVKLMQVLRQNA